MEDLHLRENRRRIFFSPITLFILGLLVFAVGRGVWGMYQREKFVDFQLTQALAQKEDLEEREAFLLSEKAKLESPEGFEGELRERFGVAKPGEKVILLIDTESTTSQVKTKDSIWEKIRSWFR
jgi:cell division protein FtsB